MIRFAFGVPLAVVVGLTTAAHLRDQFGRITPAIEGLMPPPAPVSVTIWFDPSRDRLTFLAPESGRSARPAVRLMLPPGAAIDPVQGLVTLDGHRLTATQCLLASLVGEPPGVRLAQGTQPDCPWLGTSAAPIGPPGGPVLEPGKLPLLLMVQYRAEDDRFVFGAIPSEGASGTPLLLDASSATHFHDEDDSLTLDGAPWTATRCVLSAVRGGPIRLPHSPEGPGSTFGSDEVRE
ncbi:hypothetical protein [Tautonia marina]|uniref:hypothetical protein n=1 Tax=Tautonia marina TaxID=2653855 RepID=UPI00126083B9|nr:hypothetical protein [Tautonia marina]